MSDALDRSERRYAMLKLRYKGSLALFGLFSMFGSCLNGIIVSANVVLHQWKEAAWQCIPFFGCLGFFMFCGHGLRKLEQEERAEEKDES